MNEDANRAARPIAAFFSASVASVHAATGAKRHLVADDHCLQKITFPAVQLFGQGKGGGKDLGARVSSSVDATIVDVGAVSGGRVGEGGPIDEAFVPDRRTVALSPFACSRAEPSAI
jgi:hypothetical protein